MVYKIRSMWKRATCRHEVDKLRFVRRVYDAEWETGILNGMFEYHCVGCGKKVYKERPETCEGCKYIASDKFGSILCSREYEDFCLLVNRKYWEEG